ncbi:hypothetical protein [Spirosoma utsteinense]|uniref:DUF1570 domain-containing protein n=1 Tax=Spirosoma utsteinense TaxID=2585773 RepID=A0ABR6WB58_9BACT|nr:hypothetical protein [Spirosoma utsteinense]MBC3786785.1 hypothetical protein [Spirosoma utsteinense]MBC3793794.1 hypothetical protein [Spirosoma utsteinense]
MRLLSRYVLPLLIALPIGFLILYPQLVRCMRISYSNDFRVVVAPGREGFIYVNRSASATQQTQVSRHMVAARHRIRRFWGGQQGKAILIYCTKQAEYEEYCVGGEGAGCSIGTFWGASYLILGPDGNSTDVIAHELCHDELFARLGWWRVKRQIPQWFNEGLALMVDYRFSNPSVWEQPDSLQPPSNTFDDDNLMPFARRPMLKLADLETTRDFFGGDYGHVMLAYQTAADEVSRWLALVGRAGVPALSDAIAEGADFGDAYRQLERAKRQTPTK